jgi:hypothetical protein
MSASLERCCTLPASTVPVHSISFRRSTLWKKMETEV